MKTLLAPTQTNTILSTSSRPTVVPRLDAVLDNTQRCTWVVLVSIAYFVEAVPLMLGALVAVTGGLAAVVGLAG